MNFDVAVVGSGLAGLTVALHLTDHRHMVVVSKRSLPEGASDWVRGGIATVFGSGDSHDEHIDDTLTVGVELYDEAATRYIVENGCSAIEWLIGHGVPFARDEQAELGFHLTREDDHRHQRIIHAVDATGHAVVTALVEKVCNHSSIMLPGDHFAIDLIIDVGPGRPGMRCHGLYALDIASGYVKTTTVSQTAVATGGAGKIYLCTTDPDTASGDDIAMIW